MLLLISVLEGLFGITYDYAFGLTAIITLLVAVYAALSGLLGVVVTDAMQFIIAMTGSIALAGICYSIRRGWRAFRGLNPHSLPSS